MPPVRIVPRSITLVSRAIINPRHQFFQNTATLPLRARIQNMASLDKIFAKDAAPPAGPYSQAIRAPPFIFCSGQIPADATGALVEGTLAEKTKACIDNISAILTAAGSSLEKVVKVNVFLTDMANFAEMNGEYKKHFTGKPARSCVAVKALPKGVPVEIECIALA